MADKMTQETINSYLNYWGNIVPSNTWKVGIADTIQGVVTLIVALSLGAKAYELALGCSVVSVVSGFVVSWIKLQVKNQQSETVIPWREALELLAMLIVMLASFGAVMGEPSVVGFGLVLAWVATIQNLYPLLGAYTVRGVIWVAVKFDWLMTKISWSAPEILEGAAYEYAQWEKETPG